MKIVVVGLGYVGLSNAVLLSQKNHVIGVDTDVSKVEKLNAKISPINDKELNNYIKNKKLDIVATTNLKAALRDASYVIVSTPTNYDENVNFFDTSSVENVISTVRSTSPSSYMVVKSTIPIGFVEGMRKKFNTNKIFFSPEFLREGMALYDNLYPSRIIVGDDCNSARKFAKLLQDSAKKENIEIRYTGSREAEAIKLFANSYLAMRVAYFNELDSYAISEGLQAKEIIEGVSLDPRVGMHYNNPSFGYGGYCLPKDTKQLLSNFNSVPQKMISAIVNSNEIRMDFIAKKIMEKKPKVVGIHRLMMKSGSDNFRQSSILGIISRLSKMNVKIIIFEPLIQDTHFDGFKVENNYENFISKADLIISNRNSKDLNNISEKVFSRDIYGSD